MKNSDIKLCVVNSSSMTHSMSDCIGEGLYNPARAHIHNVIKIAQYLGIKEIYDVGESINYPPSDDLALHAYYSTVKLTPIKLEQLRHLTGFKIAVMLYCFIDDSEKMNYFRSVSDAVDKIIYYASDDELYYQGYFLEIWSRAGNEFINLNKLMMILSGHCYSVDYPKLTKEVYHLPMYPNLKIKEFYELCKDYQSYPSLDFFLNCHHHTRVAVDYIHNMPNRSFLIFTNEAIYNYFDEHLKHMENVQFLISKGANTELLEILAMISKCKYYLIPNTYYHTSDWYKEGHYHQSVMYTHKVLEAYYANRMILGDLTEDNMSKLNSKKDLTFITRQNFYKSLNGVKDPMDELIVSTEIKCKMIADKITKQVSKL